MSAQLAIIGVIALFLYIGFVFRFPRTRCRKCQGSSGRHHAFPTSGSFRKCRRCKGSGWHVRPMRRVLGGGGNYDGAGVWQGP